MKDRRDWSVYMSPGVIRWALILYLVGNLNILLISYKVEKVAFFVISALYAWFLFLVRRKEMHRARLVLITMFWISCMAALAAVAERTHSR